ncbi:MAG: LptF/LptG family permease, partial [Alphaproteobacteria bacterium]|nr:LptF/LptG family permease [Alphaproteobacteria bacterium]
MFAPLTTTDRYLVRLIWPNLAMTMSAACFLLLLDKMRRLFDFVVQEGGPISVVWRMLANLIPEFLGLGIPLGLMLGILLAFRKLAISSELDVMLATGQSYTRLLRVPYIFTIGFALLNLA